MEAPPENANWIWFDGHWVLTAGEKVYLSDGSECHYLAHIKHHPVPDEVIFSIDDFLAFNKPIKPKKPEAQWKSERRGWKK